MRNLQRNEQEFGGGLNSRAGVDFNASFASNASASQSGFFRKRRFYEDNPFDGICSTAPCLWFGALLCWALVVASFMLTWMELFRPVLFLSPILLTLLCNPCGVPREPTARKLMIFSIVMFMIYWTVYMAYPEQCRSAWGYKMVTDEEFMKDGELTQAGAMKVFDHMSKIYAPSQVDKANETLMPLLQRGKDAIEGAAEGELESWEDVLKKQMASNSTFGPNKTEGNATKGKQSWPNATKASSRRASGSPSLPTPQAGAGVTPMSDISTQPMPGVSDASEQTLSEADAAELLKKVMPDGLDGATTKWLRPWTSGDTSENFLLRAYCDIHRDKKIPHVYPLRRLGVSPMEVQWKVACPYSSCVLTEHRDFNAGKLVFMWILVIPAIGNWLHARLTGVCYPWWRWLWASLIPLWVVALVKSTHNMELMEMFYNTFIRTFVELPVLFGADADAQGDGAEKQEEMRRVILLVMLVVLGGLAYYFRDVIRSELGLHEWLPFLFTGHRSSGRHTFQVCVWKVEARTHAEQGEHEEPTSFSWAQRGMQALGIPSWPSAGGLFQNKGYTALFGQGTAALPESISVRLCYGGEELQRTRVQQSGRSGIFSDMYLFQENFTLCLERRPGAVFTVEIQGKTIQSMDFSSSVNFNADRLERAFERSARAEAGFVVGQRVADQQVVKMRSVVSGFDGEEAMTRLGFHHYPGSSGGEIWLAFSDMEDESAQQNWF